MSIITLQLGQCGNQIGGELFTTFIKDAHAKPSNVQVSANRNEQYTEEVISKFFTTESQSDKFDVPQARAVLVDMEPKVIAQICTEAKRTGKWMYPEKQQFSQKRGSGNNWAHGFCVHGPRVKEKVMNMIQQEAEKCDNLGGFLSLTSLAGGTGSGVGAYVTQCLRDEFPNSFILNQVVWPYHTGEVIVQNYNAILTLSHLYQSADAVLVMENDHLHRICTQLLNIKKIGFKDINNVICHKLASFLLPAVTQKYTDHRRSNAFGEVLEHLVSHPDYKLLTIKNIPQMSDTSKQFCTYQWHGLLKHLRQMLIADASMEEGIDWQVHLGDGSGIKHNQSLANALFLRGKDLDGIDVSSFSDPKLYPSWILPNTGVAVYKQPRIFNDYEKSAALVTNSRSPIGSLNHMIGKAWNMFSSRAYVYQYEKHGLTEEDFLDSFVTLEQVVANYNTL
ncbi:hypothetical protein CHS0354_011115 [Potamilus streckersoni]|nr:hypothetical protein CHS0354_011115 [Potamilus streckersoni]